LLAPSRGGECQPMPDEQYPAPQAYPARELGGGDHDAAYRFGRPATYPDHKSRGALVALGARPLLLGKRHRSAPHQVHSRSADEVVSELVCARAATIHREPQQVCEGAAIRGDGSRTGGTSREVFQKPVDVFAQRGVHGRLLPCGYTKEAHNAPPRLRKGPPVRVIHGRTIGLRRGVDVNELLAACLRSSYKA